MSEVKKLNSLADWRREHDASYATALKLGLTQEIAALLGWKTLGGTSSEKKARIIKMAKNGEPRPHLKKHELGSVFSTYITKSSDCYDPEFVKKLRKLRSDWFVSRSTIANEKKALILKIAKKGEKRPTQRKHELGKVFSAYIIKSGGSYDPKFDKEIRALRPDWFSRSAEKKALIIEMAKNNENRPHRTKHELGSVFSTYITKSSGSYDLEFFETLKALRSDWFKRKTKT